MVTLPLSEASRPKHLAQVVGQEHLVGAQGFITKVIESKKPLSIILWGPPGCGKTTIARLYAKAFSMRFESISAIFSGISDLKKLVQDIKGAPLFNTGFVLFVDEIHRFNKAQQDAFLPFLEDGTITLVGATAENPSFYLNNALLSRVRVLKLEPLSHAALHEMIKSYTLPLTDEAKELLIQSAQGDGRYLWNLIENIQNIKTDSPLDPEGLKFHLQQKTALFDSAGDNHYNLISALHKSVRGSDPDAALYWFARILEGGESPLFLARRLIRMAAEDIGLADPQALTLAMIAKDAFEMLGSPEGELCLAEVVVYLSLAPKSNAIYKALSHAREVARKTTHLSPPLHILNAPTKLMKGLGYGEGYRYDHEEQDAFSGQNYFPEGVERESFYNPVERGFEREMQKRIAYFQALRQQRS